MSRSLAGVGIAVCVAALLAALVAGIALRASLPDLAELDPAGADAYRAISGETPATPPVRLRDFDVYRSEKGIAWVKEACANADLERPMELTIYPMDAAGRGYRLDVAGLRIGGACLWQAGLRGAALAQAHFHDVGRVNFDAYVARLRRRYVLAAAEPAARAAFDVYWEEPGQPRDAGRDGGPKLTYMKKHCRQADTTAPFFLHVTPVSRDDLPAARQPHGFASLDFRRQAVLAASFDGHCVATRALPNYAIARIVTGQHVPGGEVLWRASIAPPDASAGGT